VTRPAKQVGGDFYDAYVLPTGQIALVLADVCDKGVGAALYMALFRSLLRATAEEGGASDEVLSRSVRIVNDYIAKNHGRSNMFATVFFGLLDPATGALVYINGGHEPPALLAAGGAVRARLAPTGPALGLMPGMTFRIERESLAPGRLLVTDVTGTQALPASSPRRGWRRRKGAGRSSSR
jgi:serine phosphatase RsbU (regulator of sigma subunit)